MSAPPLDPSATPAPPAALAGNGVPYVPNLPPEVVPDVRDLVTVDDTPRDSYFAEKQQLLLIEPLYSSWTAPDGKPFLALSNVGYFYAYREPPLVPDMFLALDAVPAGPLNTKEGHSYFQWLMGKPPDVCIEMVSDKRGGEETHKMRTYARQGVPYYVIFDPEQELGKNTLRAFRLSGATYEPLDPAWFPEIGLGLRIWEADFAGLHWPWIRWYDREGNLIPTGAERAAEAERRAAEQAEKVRQLEARLRELGVDPGP